MPFWYGVLQHAVDSTKRMLSYNLCMQEDLESLLKNKKDWPEQSWTAEPDLPIMLVMTLVVPEHRASNGALRTVVLRAEHWRFLCGMPVLLFGLGVLESGWKKSSASKGCSVFYGPAKESSSEEKEKQWYYQNRGDKYNCTEKGKQPDEDIKRHLWLIWKKIANKIEELDILYEIGDFAWWCWSNISR